MKPFDYYQFERRSVKEIEESVYKANGYYSNNFSTMKQLKKEKERLDNIVAESVRREHDKYFSLIEEFKTDLFNELNINDNPKKELLFEKSRKLSHNDSLEEIYIWVHELVDLIK